MTRETKVGLMMVAVVVGVFGFLVYKRVHRPIEGIAGQTTREEARVIDEEKDAEFVDDRNPPRQFKPERTPFRKREREVVRDVELAADKVEEFAETVVDEVTTAPPEKPKRHKPRLPIELPSNDDDFAQFTEPRRPREEPRRIQTPEPAEDAFETAQQSSRPSPRMNQAEDDRAASDPFGEDTKASDVRPVQFDEPPRRENRESFVPDPGDSSDRSFSRERRSTYSAPESVAPAEEPRRVQEFEDTYEPATRGRRRPAPAGFVDDRPSRDPEIQAAVSGDGQSYIVQPNDNFWSISRKLYGAGRFYKALAMHNQQIISDPRLMRPGVVISTPDVSVLEQRYADQIPKAAPADSVTSVSTTQSRKPVESEPPGYFVSSDGAPMYRVGENDTLTGIAKAHLGRISRWVQILEMNRNVLRDGNELKIGTVLRLPADASRVQVVGTARDFR